MKHKIKVLLALMLLTIIFLFPGTMTICKNTHSKAYGYDNYSNYYAYGYINWIFKRQWTGGSVKFENPNPDYETPNSGANQTIWCSTNSSYTQWVEAGYAKGKQGDSNARYLYWASGRYDNNGNLIEYSEGDCSTPPGVPGLVHKYTIIYYDNPGCFMLFIDGYLEQTYSPEFKKYIRKIEIGLESQDYRNVCGKVHPYQMSYFSENDNSWHSFAQANPKVYTSARLYHFKWGDSRHKDYGEDWIE